MRVKWIVPGLLIATGCASTASTTRTNAPSAPVASAPSATTQGTDLPLNIRWYRYSAEKKALYLQGFRIATENIATLARGMAPQSWAIITDADETILDNSAFEETQALQHAQYSEAAWNTFVNSQVSTATPGAADFLKRVHDLGGRVVVVTNRAASVCDATRSNLQKAGLQVDLVLCKPPAPAPSDKNPRFRAVQEGTAGLPALRVLMFLGDNILDFPAMSQEIRKQPESAFEHFGRDYIVFPNPMYGSWDKNSN